jgi:hypothetical protein
MKSMYYLGQLCPYGHDAGGGKSWRYRRNRNCLTCRKQRKKERLDTLKKERQILPGKILGKPCIHGHRYGDTDQTLRYAAGGRCVDCCFIDEQKKRKKKKDKEHENPGKTSPVHLPK